MPLFSPRLMFVCPSNWGYMATAKYLGQAERNNRTRGINPAIKTTSITATAAAAAAKQATEERREFLLNELTTLHEKANRNPSTGREEWNMSKHLEAGGVGVVWGGVADKVRWGVRCGGTTGTHIWMCALSQVLFRPNVQRWWPPTDPNGRQRISFSSGLTLWHSTRPPPGWRRPCGCFVCGLDSKWVSFSSCVSESRSLGQLTPAFQARSSLAKFPKRVYLFDCLPKGHDCQLFVYLVEFQSFARLEASSFL